MAKTDLDKKYTELEEFSLTKELVSSCKEHLGIVLMVSYGLITITGMLYLYTFFNLKFNIPVLSFITLQDAMLVGIKEPKIVAAFFVVVVFQLLSDAIVRWQARTFKKVKSNPKNNLFQELKKRMLWIPSKRNSIVLSYFITILVFNFLIYELAKYNADQIIDEGKGDQVVLTLEEIGKTDPMVLLGSISQYVIVYEKKVKKSKLYSQEGLLVIERFHPTGPKEIEKKPENKSKTSP